MPIWDHSDLSKGSDSSASRLLIFGSQSFSVLWILLKYRHKSIICTEMRPEAWLEIVIPAIS
jgi:hypothetical protein